MGLNPGDLDREITFQVATKTQDADTGEQVLTWADEDDSVWAQWKPGNAREAYYERNRLKATVDGVFVIYDRTPRPTPDGYRVTFDGRTYDIQGVTEIGRGDGLLISVAARVDS